MRKKIIFLSILFFITLSLFFVFKQKIKSYFWLHDIDLSLQEDFSEQKASQKSLSEKAEKIEPEAVEGICSTEKQCETLKPKEQLSRREVFLKHISYIEQEKILAVPFVCQNPFQDKEGWKIHDESCEEAAVLQAVLFLKNENISFSKAHQKFLDMIAWQKSPEHFGKHKDLFKKDLEYFTEKYFNFRPTEVFFLEEINQNILKGIITFGLPVILPTMAKELKNPFYHHQEYHMVTLIGFNKEKAIVNDVGTKRGQHFVYSWEVLLNANQKSGGGALVIWPYK